MRDLRVWQEHEPFLTGYEPHSFVRCQGFKYIETLPARRYKLATQITTSAGCCQDAAEAASKRAAYVAE